MRRRLAFIETRVQKIGLRTCPTCFGVDGRISRVPRIVVPACASTTFGRNGRCSRCGAEPCRTVRVTSRFGNEVTESIAQERQT
jgi:hypothetical protein